LLQSVTVHLSRIPILIVRPTMKYPRKCSSLPMLFNATMSVSHFCVGQETRTILTLEQIAELQAAIDKLKCLWPTRRSWEQKEASVTPKGHNLWFEIIPQIKFLGRFYHFMEDPIERLHKEDQITDAVYCRVRNYEQREECKRKQEDTARNVRVLQRTEQVEQGRKRNFTAATIARRESKTEDAIVAKKERRSSS
jgi:hypothetical protein